MVIKFKSRENEEGQNLLNPVRYSSPYDYSILVLLRSYLILVLILILFLFYSYSILILFLSYFLIVLVVILSSSHLLLLFVFFILSYLRLCYVHLNSCPLICFSLLMIDVFPHEIMIQSFFFYWSRNFRTLMLEVKTVIFTRI